MPAEMQGIAVVTGGGSGIGAAVSKALAEDGWTVVLAGRRKEALESVVAGGSGLTGVLDAIPTDVTDEASVRRLFQTTVQRYGRVDLLFNNAGTGAPSVDIDALELEVWNKVLAVNLTGAFLCTREAFRAMRQQQPQGGRIINNGSISAHAPRPRSIAYTATKHAITGLTKSTALDGRAFDIACGQIDIGWQEVVERLWTGGRWLEGPVWFGDGRYLLFSDIPNNRMLCWSEVTGGVTAFRQPSNNSNGNTRDRQGRLVTCEHLTRRVTRTEHDGAITVLMNGYKGKPLNAPNDVTVHSDGSVWFTDPGWGIEGNYEGDKAVKELPRYVYRIDAHTREGLPVITEMDRPNGICFSPDESRLYVVDTGHIRMFDMDGTTPVNGRVFVDMGPGGSDGIRTDRDGNVWSAAGGGGAGFDGVHCYSPGGDLLGQIHLPETCANLCFGGVKKNRLFITASRSLYSVYLEAQGAQHP